MENNIVKNAFYQITKTVYRPVRRTFFGPTMWYCNVYTAKKGGHIGNMWISEESLINARRVKPTEKLNKRNKHEQ